MEGVVQGLGLPEEEGEENQGENNSHNGQGKGRQQEERTKLGHNNPGDRTGAQQPQLDRNLR